MSSRVWRQRGQHVGQEPLGRHQGGDAGDTSITGCGEQGASAVPRGGGKRPLGGNVSAGGLALCTESVGHLRNALTTE